ncbi:YdcF family protein [Blastococcus haudaquaticus]|uniref:DUF218 domain-containing protein n=1 Tax=Blastococcus haudaquaticus TaxID=1938745 RepID=A0A286GSZ6_9ACTN|nr:YdcF family protein [Blastococcus haudaquaticus]SOD98681.1 DUF218 domain-containing protein [Blastococcus haudaquaticus]
MDATAGIVGQVLGALIGALVVTGALVWSLRRDPRSLRNGFLAVLAAHTLLGLLAISISRSRVLETLADAVALVVWGVIGLGLLLLPLLLVVDGILMVRRESRSLGNALSLLTGLASIVLPVVLLELVRHENPVTGTVAVGLLAALVCIGLLFLVFVTQTALYAWLARRAPARAVIVLGAGLAGGEVPPLLAARLRRAVAAVEERAERAGTIPIVASGGQGADEPYPEGEAMAVWLRRTGVAASDVLVEDRSRTTEENLRYSAQLLRRRGIPEPYLVVTNDYHAPRAAMLARTLGIDAQAIGCRTALYYWPSAYLREFVAVMAGQRFLLALSGLVVAGLMVATWLSLSAA